MKRKLFLLTLLTFSLVIAGCGREVADKDSDIFPQSAEEWHQAIGPDGNKLWCYSVIDQGSSGSHVLVCLPSANNEDVEVPRATDWVRVDGPANLTLWCVNNTNDCIVEPSD